MAFQQPVRPGFWSRRRLQAIYRRLRPTRAIWPYALLAAALLCASEVLWLWHSWPVRQVLDSEKLIGGPTV